MNFRWINEKLEKFIEKINTDDLEMDKEDIEEIVEGIMKAIPSFEYLTWNSSCTCKATKDNYYYGCINYKGYVDGQSKIVTEISIKSYSKKVTVRYRLPYQGHGDFALANYMNKYSVNDDNTLFVTSYYDETKEEIIEDVVENFKRIFDYDTNFKKVSKNLKPECDKIAKDILQAILLKYSDKDGQEIDLSNLDLNFSTSYGKNSLERLEVNIEPDKPTLEEKCRYTILVTSNKNDIYLSKGISGTYRTESMLDALKKVLKFLSGEDDKEALRKAKRQEYNKKRWAEKKAQKLANSKPFDNFLQELRDKYGSGYIAQDVYGYTHVFKNRPSFIPTREGYEDDEEFYEPGYWTGEKFDDINYESKLNKAYKDQYRTTLPSDGKAIWKF